MVGGDIELALARKELFQRRKVVFPGSLSRIPHPALDTIQERLAAGPSLPSFLK